MKTHILVLLAALGGLHGVSSAQSPVQEVIDNAMLSQSRTNTDSITALLQQQLDEAKLQTQNLNDQLSRMGNPADVTLPTLDIIKEDITKSVDNANTGAERGERIRNTDGNGAFGDNTFGLMPAIGSTVSIVLNKDTPEETTVTENRDPESYRLHAALMQDLNALAAKSTAADERAAILQGQRSALLDQVSAATDLTTVFKLQVALQAIEANITETKADLAKSKQDYDVLQEKLRVQSQIAAQGKREERELENERRAQEAPVDTTPSPAGTIPFSGMRWGRTGTTTP